MDEPGPFDFSVPLEEDEEPVLCIKFEAVGGVMIRSVRAVGGS